MKKKRWMILLSVLILLGGIAVARESGSVPTVTAAVEDKIPAPENAAEASNEPAPMTDIHDIKPLFQLAVPVSLAAVLLWAGSCLLAALLIAGAWLLWKRRRKPLVETIEATLSPEDAAVQKLSVLSPDTRDGKGFYFQLSAILREYIQGKFGIDGPEMTTEELMPHVAALKVESFLRREVKAFLLSSDPVKFAAAPAHREAMQHDLEFVRAFVKKTSAPPPESTGVSAARNDKE